MNIIVRISMLTPKKIKQMLAVEFTFELYELNSLSCSSFLCNFHCSKFIIVAFLMYQR